MHNKAIAAVGAGVRLVEIAISEAEGTRLLMRRRRATMPWSRDMAFSLQQTRVQRQCKDRRGFPGALGAVPLAGQLVWLLGARVEWLLVNGEYVKRALGVDAGWAALQHSLSNSLLV